MERARQRTWLVDLRQLAETPAGLVGQLIYVHHDVMIGVNFQLQGTDVALGSPAVFIEAAGVKGRHGRAVAAGEIERAVLAALDVELVARDVRERVLGL